LSYDIYYNKFQKTQDPLSGYLMSRTELLLGSLLVRVILEEIDIYESILLN
jgi:hypothetical protein